jgi:hypothetical protein
MSPPKLAKPVIRRSRLVEAFEEFFQRLLPTGRRAAVFLGVKPLRALNAVYPEFNAAVVYLDLRFRIARSYRAADERLAAVGAARNDVERALNAMTNEHYERAAAWLRDTVGEVPASRNRQALIDAVRKQLDTEYPRPGPAAGAAKRFGKKAPRVKVTGRPQPRTAFDQLEELSALSGQVAHALHTFQQACLYENATVIRGAAERLQQTIAEHGKRAGLDGKARARCSRAVEATVRSFERQLPTAEGLQAVLAFWRAFDQLPPNDPFVAVYRRLQSWLDPADLERLGTAVARLWPIRAAGATKEALEAVTNAVRGRTSCLVGLLGELVGRKGGYRRMFERQLRRARSFAEGPGGGAWKVYVARTPVRGLTADGKTFQQFYDDAILLVDEARGKIAVSFSAQFKAGDPASLEVLAQLDSDELRLRAGKMVVDGKQYEVELGVLPHETAIITTTIGVAEARTFTKKGRTAPRATSDPTAIATAIGDREIQFWPMPVDPEDLRALVLFLLRAADKVPSN